MTFGCYTVAVKVASAQIQPINFVGAGFWPDHEVGSEPAADARSAGDGSLRRTEDRGTTLGPWPTPLGRP